MFTTWKTRTALGLAGVTIASIGWGVAAQAAPAGPPTPVATTSASPAVPADATLAKNLTFLREEERLARDLYIALAAKYPQAAPFATIARSEQRHVDTVGLLLARYGISDPSVGRSAGSFADPDLQALYERLLATGGESLAKAYEVGVTVENKDIADLKAAIARTTQADVKAALTNLMAGSEHHLAAFTAAQDGRTLGARNGQGLQSGRSGTPATRARTGGPSAGTGQGFGRGQNPDRPATCPAR